MIIHSIMPFSCLMEQPAAPVCSVRPVSGGFIEGEETPQGFKTTRLISTDLSMFLKNEYAPGSILPPDMH